MVDFRLYLGGAAGKYSLTNVSELEPYDNKYFLTDIYLGVEPIANFNFLFLPFIPKKTLRMNPIVEGHFTHVGGDEGNLGSNRLMGDAEVGLRTRIGNSDDVVVFVDVLAGVGVSRNRLNGGKGVPLPTKIEPFARAQARAGAQWCLGDFCLGPAVTVAKDVSFGDRMFEGGLDVLFGVIGGGKAPSYVEPPPVCERCPE